MLQGLIDAEKDIEKHDDSWRVEIVNDLKKSKQRLQNVRRPSEPEAPVGVWCCCLPVGGASQYDDEEVGNEALLAARGLLKQSHVRANANLPQPAPELTALQLEMQAELQRRTASSANLLSPEMQRPPVAPAPAYALQAKEKLRPTPAPPPAPPPEEDADKLHALALARQQAAVNAEAEDPREQALRAPPPEEYDPDKSLALALAAEKQLKYEELQGGGPTPRAHAEEAARQAAAAEQAAKEAEADLLASLSVQDAARLKMKMISRSHQGSQFGSLEVCGSVRRSSSAAAAASAHEPVCLVRLIALCAVAPLPLSSATLLSLTHVRTARMPPPRTQTSAAPSQRSDRRIPPPPPPRPKPPKSELPPWVADAPEDAPAPS